MIKTNKMNIKMKKNKRLEAHSKEIKFFMVFCMAIFLLNVVDAGKESLGIFEQNESVRVTQICDDAYYVNISSIAYPNSSIAESKIEMTSAGNG